jgi:penicillin-insensitive murein endopeptidase
MMRSGEHGRRSLALSIGAALVLACGPAVAGDDATRDVPSAAPIAFPAPDAVAAEAYTDAPDTSLPDPDALRRLVEKDPAALGPLSIGTPDGGLLFNPEPMREGPFWTVRDPAESFATDETIGFIITAIEAVEARFPGSPRVVIGDVSRPDGGRLNRHRSHQVGRDADIGFYYRSGELRTFRKPGKNELDLPRTWTLVRALVTDTDVDRIFLDRSIQRLLYAHALSEGEDRAWLDDIFGRRPDGEKGIIQHERRHKNHLHVRFYNRRAQEWGRLAYPLLVELELAPGPTVTHRARRGDTLSGLAERYGTSAAKIRAANGIKGSRLRAGRRYVIPVRRVPSESAPVVVPPRRLPPMAPAVAQGSPPAAGEAAADARR